MTVYTVHFEGETTEAARFVPEGFSWRAFLVPPLWLLWHRLWLAFGLWCVAFALLIAAPLQPLAKELFLILIGLLCGLEGQQWYRQNLIRDGKSLADIVSGDTLDDAEIHFFHRWAGREPKPPVATSYPHRIAPVSAAETPFGLFPEPETRP